MKKITLFILLVVAVSHVKAQNIVAMEYWIDTDPGYDSGYAVSTITPAPDIANQLFNIPNLSVGPHVIGTRTKDANNVWSHCNFNAVLIYDTLATGSIVGLEFFWDIDSGMGYYIPYIPSTFVTDLTNDSINIPVQSNLNVGQHTLFARSYDSNGKWSHTNYVQNVTIDTLITGINELSGNGISVYPNPVINELNINIKENQKMRLILFNSSGQLVIDKTIEASGKINLQGIEQGAYTVFIWAERHAIYRTVIIKQ